MRRHDRAIIESEAFKILSRGEYGYLSSISRDGTPYGVPVNYSNTENKIYVHCALEGEKLENIRRNNNVSFAVVGNTLLLPEKFGTLYESVIIRGRAEEVHEQEKQEALESILIKYSSEFKENGFKYIKAMTLKTIVIGISIDNISGKARKK